MIKLTNTQREVLDKLSAYKFRKIVLCWQQKNVIKRLIKNGYIIQKGDLYKLNKVVK